MALFGGNGVGERGGKGFRVRIDGGVQGVEVEQGCGVSGDPEVGD
jgi:hypothetical protein